MHQVIDTTFKAPKQNLVRVQTCFKPFLDTRMYDCAINAANFGQKKEDAVSTTEIPIPT
jgi:hypothetical protein